MFLCAVAHPRFDDSGTCIFDGKLGIWPFIQKVQAQQTSSNHPRRTWETKPVTVTKDVYREYIIVKLLPAIYEKFPHDRSHQQNVFLHQDNPNTHISSPKELQQVGNLIFLVSCQIGRLHPLCCFVCHPQQQ